MDNLNVKSNQLRVEPFIFVLFGGTGDLSQKKILPALFNLFKENRLNVDFKILSIGSRKINNEEYKKLITDSIRKNEVNIFTNKELDEFLGHVTFFSHDVTINGNESELCDEIHMLKDLISKSDIKVLFYLAVPANLLPLIIERLRKVNLCANVQNSKIAIEKPFGHNKQSSIDLNNAVAKVFTEKQIYRMDHYLGKDTIQNILFLRFGNSIFEPLWNSQHIDHIQITVAEDIGIQVRGKFYEQTGVIRDVVQNHLLQMLALVAMEPPISFDAEYIRDEKVKVYRTVNKILKDQIEKNTVIGQYGSGIVNNQDVLGYRQEENVDLNSKVPTFFAARFFIDNWRWAKVPFYVRVGKRLAKQSTEIYIQFKQAPLKLFKNTCSEIESNSLVLSIQPDEEMNLKLNIKYPGVGNHPTPINMHFNYDEDLKIKRLPAYQRLLMDMIKGDSTLFPRQDGIDAMWEIVDPIIEYWESKTDVQFPNYRSGSWGPDQAAKLIENDNRNWHN